MAFVDQGGLIAGCRPELALRPHFSPPAWLPEVEPAAWFRWKPWVDRVLAALILVPCLPLLGLLACWAGIFRQVRAGKDGRRFTMYKIRTMRRDAEAALGVVWAKRDDPRVSRVGRVLRRMHLDELPQLFNILRGEMSLVGPRPERPPFVRVLSRHVPGYVCRLRVRPGITGLAQVNLPPDSDLESVRNKLALDLEYVQQAGLLLDLRLLLCTLLRLLRISAVDLLGLRRAVPARPAWDGDPLSRGGFAAEYVSPTRVAQVAAGGRENADGKNAQRLQPAETECGGPRPASGPRGHPRPAVFLKPKSR